MIWLSLDNYLSKRAWSTEGAFSQFHAVMTGWMGETKRIYEATLINQYVGNTVSQANKATVSIDVTSAIGSATGEEANRLEASAIAEEIKANALRYQEEVKAEAEDFANVTKLEALQYVDNMLEFFETRFSEDLKTLATNRDSVLFEIQKLNTVGKKAVAQVDEEE
jgi:hypothetical protein